MVEEQQVLALDVEDQRLGVGRRGAEHAGVEQRVEQERGVARLRGDAARCREMLTWAPLVPSMKSRSRTTGSPSRLSPAGSRRSTSVEVERLVTLGVDRPADLGAGQRRHERLRHDPGDLDLSAASDDLGRQDARRRSGRRRCRTGPPRGGPAPGRRCRRSRPLAGRAGCGRRRRRRRAGGAGRAPRPPRTPAAWRRRCRAPGRAQRRRPSLRCSKGVCAGGATRGRCACGS